MGWEYVVIYVIALAIAVASIPKPETQPPASLGEFNIPTVSSSKEIPILFGTKEIKSANIVWYGNLKSIAIRGKGGKK